MFEAQAEQIPNALALETDAARLTFAELNEKANRLARRLRTAGVGPEVLVGVYIRSEEHTSELQSQSNLVCRLLLEKKKTQARPPAPNPGDRSGISHRGCPRASLPSIQYADPSANAVESNPKPRPLSDLCSMTQLA